MQRFHGNALNSFAFELLDILADARDGAAGTHATDKHVHRAIRIVPYFRAGGLEVTFRIGRVLELLRQKIFRVSSAIRSASAMAPGMPFEPGVRMRSAPKALSMARRSTLMVSGMVRMSR